jgi:intracellular sulfur oxidation DsrE/DsrF family protein
MRNGATMRLITRIFFLVLFLVGSPAIASESATGPVIDNFGPVYAVPQDSYNLAPNQQYKVVMDVGKGPEDPAQLNRSIESAARAALNEQAYSKHFKVPNGSKGLIEALGNAGVDIYICGQTAAYYGYGADDLLPQITMAVSAMTVHVRLQQEGYRAILF